MDFIKKLVLASFLLVSFSGVSQAQAIVGSTDETLFEIGLNGGVLLGNINRDDDADTLLSNSALDVKVDDEDISLGFIGFLRFAVILASVFSIDFNIGYAQRGSDLEHLNISGGAADPLDGKDIDFCVDTIAFPLMLKYLFSGGDFIPFIGLLLDLYVVLEAELDYDDDGTPNRATVDLDENTPTGVAVGDKKDIIENFGFGIGPILGFMYFVSEWVAITFHAMFSYSLTDLMDAKISSGEEVDAHLYSFWFLLGFSYFWG